jgi:protein translocase subunit secA
MKKPGRNEPCPCGSGKKYKYCHGSGILRERKIECPINCKYCDNKFTIDMTGNIMNIFATQDRLLKEYCKDNNFYFFEALNLADSLKLLKKLCDGNISKESFFDIYKTITKKEMLRLFSLAFNNSSIFKKREQILLDIIDSHYQKKYTLSIPVLFTQLEGVLREYGGLKPKDNMKPTIPTKIWDTKLAFSVKDSAEYFNGFIASLFEGSKNENEFNRNPILHGLNVSYYSEEHSLILLLAILEIYYFISHENNLPEIIKTSI